MFICVYGDTSALPYLLPNHCPLFPFEQDFATHSHLAMRKCSLYALFISLSTLSATIYIIL